VSGIIAAVLVVATVAAFGRNGAGEPDFNQRRERAEELVAQAAAAENWAVGISPQRWIREEQRIDRTSRSASIDRWEGTGQPSTGEEPPLIGLLFIDEASYVRSPRFDKPSATEPTWYHQEDSDGPTPEAFDALVQAPWALLDKYSDDMPRLEGSEVIDGEQLDRFELFIPSSAFDDGESVTIDLVGLLDPSNGLTISFWFADDGEMRRMLAVGDAVMGFSSYEYRSELFNEPIAIETPVAPRSWNEFKEAQTD
jgi:hypothetical protein